MSAARVDQAQRLMAELSPDRAARVAFILATSARWGESERAERTDVAPWLVQLRGTKTLASRRMVPVVIEEQGALLAFALEHAEGEAGPLFASWPNCRRDLASACERAGIAACSPNDLRRSFAHWLRQRGIAPDLVAPAMGHVDSRMVERVYGRLQGTELATAMLAAVAHVQQPLRTGRQSLLSVDSREAGLPVFSVPRDGIEPPTRGFSIRASTASTQRLRRSRMRSQRVVRRLVPGRDRHDVFAPLIGARPRWVAGRRRVPALHGPGDLAKAPGDPVQLEHGGADGDGSKARTLLQPVGHAQAVGAVGLADVDRAARLTGGDGRGRRGVVAHGWSIGACVYALSTYSDWTGARCSGEEHRP